MPNADCYALNLVTIDFQGLSSNDLPHAGAGISTIAKFFKENRGHSEGLTKQSKRLHRGLNTGADQKLCHRVSSNRGLFARSCSKIGVCALVSVWSHHQ